MIIFLTTDIMIYTNKDISLSQYWSIYPFNML